MTNESNAALARMQQQLKIMWVVIGALSFLVVGGFGTVGYLLTFGQTVPLNSTVTSLRVASSKSGGDSLILSPDGLSITNAAGKTIAELHDIPDYGPELVIERWRDFDPYKFLETGKSGPPELTSSMHVTASNLEISGGVTQSVMLDLDPIGGGTLSFSDKGNNTLVSTTGFTTWNECGDATATCYASRASLSTTLGLGMKVCEKHLGQPLNAKNTDQGCNELTAVPRGSSGEGGNVALSEGGISRLILGGAILTSKQVGGTIITPISQLTAFDKKGVVIWKFPPN